jgi:toxin ParE1/3/4
MKILVVSAKALADMEGITAFIALDNPTRARSFVEELRIKMDRIAEQPQSYRERDEWSPGIRSALHGHYHILFHDFHDRVRITRVIDSARDIGKLTRHR